MPPALFTDTFVDAQANDPVSGSNLSDNIFNRLDPLSSEYLPPRKVPWPVGTQIVFGWTAGCGYARHFISPASDFK